MSDSSVSDKASVLSLGDESSKVDAVVSKLGHELVSKDRSSQISNNMARCSGQKISEPVSSKKKRHSGSKARIRAVEDKLDRFIELMMAEKEKQATSCLPEPEVKRVRNQYGEHSRISHVSEDSDDILSLQPGQHEFLSGSEEEMPQLKPELPLQGLLSLFGDDATTSRTKSSNNGLKLDKTQRDTLSQNWRTQNPATLSAFAEECVDLFPIAEEDEGFLKVPTLDSIVEGCLIRKHGKKAIFGGKTGTSLYQQPYKSVEKLAYKGQQASLMGIRVMLFLQQALGKVKEGLLVNGPLDREVVLDQIQNVFAMSTRGLDQLGRAGALHHLIRRSVTLSDTSLYEIENYKSLLNLPLTGDGVFGSMMEKELKDKKEQRKAVLDLLPPILKDRKRKASGSEGSSIPQKKVFRNYNYPNNNSNFRSQRYSSERFDRKNFQTGYGKGRKPSFTATSTSKGSKD